MRCLKTRFENLLRSLNLGSSKTETTVCLDWLNSGGDGLVVLCVPSLEKPQEDRRHLTDYTRWYCGYGIMPSQQGQQGRPSTYLASISREQRNNIDPNQNGKKYSDQLSPNISQSFVLCSLQKSLFHVHPVCDIR